MTVLQTPSAFASPLPAVIDELWERRAELSPADAEAVDLLDTGAARVAFVDPATDEVVVDERAKKYAGGEFGLPGVLVLKRLSEGERHNKAKLNDILRDSGLATG